MTNWKATEALVNFKLIELGYETYIPFIGGGEIDIIAVKDDKVFKIQVKSATPKKESCEFHLCRNKCNYKNTIRFNYVNIDIFILYDGNSLYKVTLKDLNGNKHFTIRYSKPKNNQKLKINLAEDYLFKDL